MQLMPYTAQTKTLNPDELSKLYNMNPYNRPVVSPNMVNYPNMQSGISLVHQQNTSQMSLAQSSLNTAQYMTTMPYIQQGNDRLYYCKQYEVGDTYTMNYYQNFTMNCSLTLL